MRLKPRATFGWMQGKRLNSTHRFGTTGTPLHEVRSIPFCGFREHLCTETNDFIGSTVHLLDQTYDHNSARMPGYLSNMKSLTWFKRCDPGSFWPLSHRLAHERTCLRPYPAANPRASAARPDTPGDRSIRTCGGHDLYEPAIHSARYRITPTGVDSFLRVVITPCRSTSVHSCARCAECGL